MVDAPRISLTRSGGRESDAIPLAMAGLLARGSPPVADLPGFPVVEDGNRLAADSCGGSRGVGPVEVRTAFPFDPLELAPSGNHRRATIGGDREACQSEGGRGSVSV